MDVSLFDFDLPLELIAQQPANPRDSSRLLVLNRAGASIAHRHFYDLPEYLQAGDLLVLNDTRVRPARLHGRKVGGSAHVEVLLLRPLRPLGPGGVQATAAADGWQAAVWEALCRPGRRLPPGSEAVFGPADGPPRLFAQFGPATADGVRRVTLRWQGDFEQLLAELGEMPLPPYIHERLDDPERYQTVYARETGSAAAPTAGLHFTPELLAKLQAHGVGIAYVTLHVGLGTFRPIQTERIEEHQMHSEFYTVPPETAARCAATRAAGGRVIAVGTTACRSLEAAAQGGTVTAGSGWTDLFIYPGYTFKAIDALLTNFHLPRSTLLLLVSALAGRDLVMAAYAEAVAQRYRFFSFGDAMLII